MTAERKEKLRDVYNQMLFEMQLGLLLVSRYGDFKDLFEIRMKSKNLGECTDEDIEWLYEQLDEWNKFHQK